jgi:hypothetical protein
MPYTTPDPELARIGHEQEVKLTAAVTDGTSAKRAAEGFLLGRREQAIRVQGALEETDPLAIDVISIQPPGVVGPMTTPPGGPPGGAEDPSNAILAVAGELLVLERDREDAVALLRRRYRGITHRRLTERVTALNLPGADAQALVDAQARLEDQGLTAYYHLAMLYNDSTTTVKSVVPALRPGDYILPSRPDVADGCCRRPTTVAIIDTGAEWDRAERTDGWLVDVAGDSDPATQGFDTTRRLDFGAGHGTAVAGIVQLVAPHVQVVVYRAFDNGVASEEHIADAVRRACQDGADVINMSFGMTAIDQHSPLCLHDVIASLPDDVLVVAAAGNSASVQPHYPAAFKRVIAVGSLTVDGLPAGYSNRGWWVDVSVRGSVCSTFAQGTVYDENDHEAAVFAGLNPIAAVTGTSFAAPQVAGRLAQLRSEGLSAAEAVTRLRSRGVPLPEYGLALRILEQ